MRWWNPLDLLMGIKLLLGWRETKRRTLKLVEATRPDVVHLNSMPLVASASALSASGVPFVWHVREPPPGQGWRTGVIRAIMRRAPALIFISEYDRDQWLGDPHGEIIRNFVDFDRFHPAVDGGPVRKHLGLSESQPILLYAGGIAEVKGCFVLLKALAELKNRFPDVVCLMPGTEETAKPSATVRVARKVLPAIGMRTQTQRFNRVLCGLGLQDNVRRLPFRADMENLIAAADLMLFPATVPHFARPVIEAAAMGKPSIGSDLGGVNELIEHNHSGILVRGGCPSALAQATSRLLENPVTRGNLGQVAYHQALNSFGHRSQVAKLFDIFEKVRQKTQ